MLGCTGSLQQQYQKCVITGLPVSPNIFSTSAEILNFHDAIDDSRALMQIILSNEFTFDMFLENCHSLQSVLNRKSNPLLKAKLVTELVAQQVPNLSCNEYLNMSEDDLIRYLKSHGLLKVSISACIKKRRTFLNAG